MKRINNELFYCLILVNAALLSACQKQDSPPASQEMVAQEPAIIKPYIPAESIFVQSDRQLMETGHKAPCALDTINGESSAAPATVAPGSKVTFSGWIATVANQVPETFQVVLSNDDHFYVADGHAGRERADVAKALQAESLRMSGFTIVADSGAVLPGEYKVSLIHSNAGRVVSCANRATMSFTASNP